jgi:hypothetical protein
MADGISPRPLGRARGRPYEKGRLGNPAGRQTGSRNKATLAAAAFLAGESEALTCRALSAATRLRFGFASSASCRLAANAR